MNLSLNELTVLTKAMRDDILWAMMQRIDEQGSLGTHEHNGKVFASIIKYEKLFIHSQI